MTRVLAALVGLASLPVTWPIAAVMAVMAYRSESDLEALVSRPVLRRELERAA